MFEPSIVIHGYRREFGRDTLHRLRDMGRIYEQTVRTQPSNKALRSTLTDNRLGLRSVAAKILLLLCDLYFVVFASSNVTLALDTLYDHRWACYDEHTFIAGSDKSVQAACPNNASICYKQRALSGVLLVSLLAWCITFSLSVLRVVERLRPD